MTQDHLQASTISRSKRSLLSSVKLPCSPLPPQSHQTSPRSLYCLVPYKAVPDKGQPSAPCSIALPLLKVPRLLSQIPSPLHEGSVLWWNAQATFSVRQYHYLISLPESP